MTTKEEILKASEDIDWKQIVFNGGPPCFYIEEEHFCLRAHHWPGHDGMHKFVSLNDLLKEIYE